MKRKLAFVIISTTACASVLGLRTESDRPFPHRAHVTEGIPCTECHAEILEAGEEGPLHMPGNETCARCHGSTKDSGPRAPGSPACDASRNEGVGAPCRSCHGLDDTDRRVGTAKHYLRFAHAKHLPEIAGNCARCHQDVHVKNHTLLPKMASCLSCHEHADSFPLADCDGCHFDLETEEVRPASHLVHEEDYVRRHAADAAESRALCETCHPQSQCAGCHGVNVPALPQRLTFDQPALSGLHRAGFRSRHGREAAASRGLCVTCHTEASCNACHAEQGLAANGAATRNPHPAGWVGVGPGSNAHGSAARRDPVNCAGCHGGAGEALCVECHRVGGVGGTVHPPGWESRRNPRTEQPCRMCHQ